MDQSFAKIDRINELIESGADAEVVEAFALRLEEEFLAAATAHLQKGESLPAVEQYFLALQVPNRSGTREEMFRRAVRAFLLLHENGNATEVEKRLQIPRFKNLFAELIERVETEKRRNLDERFTQLDGCSSLRAKNFVALEALLQKMGETITTRYLVARVRLAREKNAQEFFNQIINKVQGLADRADLTSLSGEVAEEIQELRRRAVIFSTGIHSIYGEQIREYIERAEELFIKSHTETVIDEIHIAGSKLLQAEFGEFKNRFKPDVDPVELLKSLVKGLRIFSGESLFGEIQKVGALWAKNEGGLRFRLQAIEEPENALVTVTDSLAIIDEHRSILPLEISDELRAFLIALSEELTQREIPNVSPVAPPPSNPVVEKKGCLARLVGWLPGSTSLMKQLTSVVLFVVSFAFGVEPASAQTDVVLAVDLSGTMKQNDPNRLRYYGADQFLSMLSYYNRNQNRAAVVTFGNSAQELMPFGQISRDKAGKFQNLFDNLPVEDWTELGQGLQLSQQLMGSTRSTNRSIILISDGYIEGNPDTRNMRQDQARIVAERELWQTIVPSLKSRGIKVYTIGLFSSDDRGRPLMEKLAHETGGSYTQVTDPRQFYEIYKRMLDDIEPPSGVADVKGENSKFPLTPADYGIIITGQGDFSVRAPNGLIYPSKGPNPDPTVSQQYIQYPDGQGILFLGQPATSEQQVSSHWTGEWGIRLPNQGVGQVTYLSTVRFISKGTMPPRQAFFRNEYVPINYALEVRPDLDENTKSFLEKCQTHYTMVRTDQNTGWSRAGTIKPTRFQYLDYGLVDQAGDFLMEVEMVCQNIPYRKTREKFHVFDAELIKLGVVDAETQKPIQGQSLNEGGLIRLVGEINMNEIAKYFPEYRGLKDQKLDLELRYNSNQPQTMSLNPQSNAQLNSDEHEVEEQGTLNVDGTLTGNIIVQRSDGEGMIYYPMQAKLAVALQVRRPWSETLWEIATWIVGLLTLLATLTALFVFVRHKQWQGVGNMTLEASGGFSRPFETVNLSLTERLKRAFALRGGPHISIGGPGSNADVTIPTGPNTIIAEIGKDIFNKSYIVQKGTTQVYLQLDPLEPNVRTRIEPNDVIMVGGQEISFTGD